MARRSAPRRAARNRPRWVRSVAALVVVLALVAGLAYGGWRVWQRASAYFETPVNEGCQVTVGASSYTLDLEQSGNAAIITAEALRRGLPARAASIALATAMQESRLRNLSYGDRDSIGLFQQRPSQGWGTKAQIMDPWYSSGKFYDELIKVSDWRTGDINDVAQEVQKSGVPDGYRKHVDAAKAWASTLTGQSPRALSCVNRSTEAGTTASLAATALKGLGTRATVTRTATAVTIRSTDSDLVWAGVALTMASNGKAPITSAAVGTAGWSAEAKVYAAWATSTGPSSSPSASSTGTTTGTVRVLS
ncbi:hypothetical protein [Acidipropionibacterium jensenii]|uniref:hypothetical protein n=1 Tax=Acidipropionibacterium jensenii TaxID=1749 RepID=UPI0027DE3D33|nr:hypothetical protein [Acidipropionibacterium jensenii]